MLAIVQRRIAPGSTIGGMLFDRSGYQATFMASAALLLLAAILTLLTARAGQAHAA